MPASVGASGTSQHPGWGERRWEQPVEEWWDASEFCLFFKAVKEGGSLCKR